MLKAVAPHYPTVIPFCLAVKSHCDGCLEPLQKFRGGEHLILPKAVADTTNSNIIFSIMNPTPNPKILKKNVQVAELHPVEQVMSCKSQDKENKLNVKSRIAAIQTDKIPKLQTHLLPLIENTSKKLTKEQRVQLTKAIYDFSDIFVGPDGALGQTTLVEHRIDTGDAKPIKLPPRR